MRFYQYSENNYSTFPITTRQLPCPWNCPAEAIMIWLIKQIDTLSNHSFKGVLVKLFGQKSRKFPRKMSAVESCFGKVTGQRF